METQTPQNHRSAAAANASSATFSAGAVVIYGMHGKCAITGIENRTVDNEQISFYKLEVQKSALSRSNRQDPAIWVPVASAKNRGLRLPVDKSTAEAVMSVLSSREYYFQANEPWSAIQPKLESTIRSEGAIGLAKVASYLFVLKRKQVVAAPEVAKMIETVNKLLYRELSEALGEPVRVLEERVTKSMRQKLVPDT